MPVGSVFPESGWRFVHEGGVKVGEPGEAGFEFRIGNLGAAAGKAGGIEIFHDHEDFIAMGFEGIAFGHAAGGLAAGGPCFIPLGFDLIGFHFAFVGASGVPAAWMVFGGGPVDVFDDNAFLGRSFELAAYDFAVAAPEALYDFGVGDGCGTGGVEGDFGYVLVHRLAHFSAMRSMDGSVVY